jgi:hypothetical protein
MKCPSCGNEIPLEAGQHATVPAAGVVECPHCGASVPLEQAAGEGDAERTTEGGGWGEQRPESFAGHETVEGVREEIERKEDE